MRLEKLGESGEADAVRDRHGDHYTDRAADLASLVRCGDERLMDWATSRSAIFGQRSRGVAKTPTWKALRLAASPQLRSRTLPARG